MKKAIPLVLLAIATANGLSACQFEGVSSDAMQLRLVDSRLELRLCQPIAATTLFVESRGTDWEVLWDAAGEASLTSGDVITAGVIAERFETVSVDPRRLSEGDEVSVVVEGESQRQFALFRIEADAAAGFWQDPIGSSAARDVCP